MALTQVGLYISTVQQQQLALCDQLDRYLGDMGLPNVQVAHQHLVVVDRITSHRLQLLRPPGLQKLINACHPLIVQAEFLDLPQQVLGADKVLS